MAIQFQGEQALPHATSNIENAGEIIWQYGLESPRVIRRNRNLEFSQMVLKRTRAHIALSLELLPFRISFLANFLSANPLEQVAEKLGKCCSGGSVNRRNSITCRRATLAERPLHRVFQPAH
jgi:hypothetical protein